MKVLYLYITTLLKIRYRNFALKDLALPYVYVISFVILHAVVWQNPTYSVLLLLIVVEQVKYHITRLDLDFLKKVLPNLYLFLFAEYCIIALIPISVLLIIQSYGFALIYILIIGLLPKIPQIKSEYTIKYPFINYFPEWKIYFRKKYLLPLLLIPYVLLIPTIMYQNINIAWFGFLVIIALLSSVYFEREPLFFLKKVAFHSKDYFKMQLTNAFKNTAIFSMPYAFIILFFYPEQWMLIVAVSLISMLLIGLSIVLKYAYYDSQFIQSIGFGLVISSFLQPMMVILSVLFVVVSYKKCLLFLKNTLDE